MTHTIAPLTRKLIDTLTQRWSDALGGEDLAPALQQTFRSRPKISALATNPMLLSLIVLVQYVRGLIPERRHILYADCVSILLERRYAPPKVQEAYDSVLRATEAEQILRSIALQMHRARIRETSLRTMLTEFLPIALASMPLSAANNASANEILSNIEERSQLLVERGLTDEGEPLVAFSHLTFQEYLASVALKDATTRAGEPPISERLLADYLQDPEWWEEVALLFAAQLDPVNQSRFLDRLVVKPTSGSSQ